MSISTEAESELRRRAERRADAKIGFNIHALIYLIVNLFLVALNYFASPGQWWAQWPVLGWGIGLLAHGLSVHVRLGGSRERMIAAEMERLRGRS